MLKKECDNCGRVFKNLSEGADVRVNSYSKTVNLCEVCFDEEVKPVLEGMNVISRKEDN